ncbi:MAG: YkgJ family cysteine cluster protein [Thermovirgaceae bacterium]
MRCPRNGQGPGFPGYPESQRGAFGNVEKKGQTRLIVNKPWWEDGLRFSCLGCGRCCRGEPGTVLVTSEEASAISDRIQVAVELFTRTVRFLGEKKLSLRERPSGECVFYDKVAAKCRLYELRPLQCRLYPFWPSVLKNRTAWEKEKCRCPGIGHGKWYSSGEIRQFLGLAPHSEL